MFKYQRIKPLLRVLDTIQDSVYSFFYKLKAPKVGYYLSTPFYALQILLLDKTWTQNIAESWKCRYSKNLGTLAITGCGYSKLDALKETVITPVNKGEL